MSDLSVAARSSVSAGTSQVLWPTAVPPLAHPRHEERLTVWLLDILPPEMRNHRVVHRHLAVLLLFAYGHTRAVLEGTRRTYAQTRAALGSQLPPESIAAALRMLAEFGDEVKAQAAFVEEMCIQHGIELPR